MAYFRCGGGGMPAGLQSGMDAVLNKKFGTSTTYPASGWPDNVNLLGPLPIIVSNKAPIVSFADGANDVPIEQGTFYVVPSQAGTGTPSPSNPRAISGYTGMTITHTHKNLAYEVYEYNARNMIISPVYLPQGQYTISFSRGVNVQYIYVRKGDTVNLTGDAYATKSNSTFFTFTADESTYYYVQLYRTATSDTWEDYPVTNPQIEAGSTQTAYTAYTAPETLAVSWQTEAGTVYGGELNVTTGVLTVTDVIKTFTGGSSENWGDYSAFNGYYITIADMKDGTRQPGVCNMLERSTTNASGQTNAFWLGVGNRRLYVIGVYDSMGNTLEAFKTYLSNNNLIITYPLATPITVQLDPHAINTFYGANNFYCDTGDSQLNYRADISLYINNH